MNGRDGRYDSGDDDADWLLSQLGSGRRPDLEGRTAPNPPVAPAPQQPAAPVPPPPMERPRRRTEESLDWFSLAEPAPEADAATRELPVVGEPIRPRDEGTQEAAQPAWEQNDWEPRAPAWNQPPAWDDRRPPMPPRPPQHPGPQDRLTSVEPPVGAPVPPAFGGPQAPPPGPATPPANFALTWGEQQPVETEDDLRAAFRQLSEPSSEGARDDRATPPGRDDHRAERHDEPDAAQPPLGGFTPPPVARQSFTPVPPPAGGQAFPPARTDFDDELWSALNEEPQQADASPRAWEQYDDGRGYSDEQAYADSSGQDDQGPSEQEQGYSQQGYSDQGYSDRGYSDQGYSDQGYSDQGYSDQGYSDQGYSDQGYSDQGYSDQGYSDQGHSGQPYAGPGYDGDGASTPGFGDGANPFAGFDRRFGDDGTDDRRFDDGGLDPRWFDGSAVDDPSPRNDDAPFFEQDERDAAPSGPGGLGFDGFEEAGAGDEEPSPMARELAQTGYFWNLTPDPNAPDPKAPADDAPGPRRRGTSDADPFTGRDTGPSDERDDERSAFDDPFIDQRTADDDRSRPSDDAPDWWETPTSGEQGDADPYGEVRSDPYRDARYDDELPGPDGPRREPGTDGDGLASLFGGAGFGLTGPNPIAGGPAASRTAGDDPFGLGAEDEYDPYGHRARGDRSPFDHEPLDRDPFGPDDDPFARRDPFPRDAYDDGRSVRAAASAPRPTREDDDRGGRSPVKLLAWIAGGLAAVLLVVAGVSFASQLLGGGAPVADEAPVEVAEPTAMQPPGVHAWNQLFGGECLEPFDGPWAEEFTVVDCAAPHTAQLVLRGDVSTDQAAPFPGEAEIAAQVAALCSAEGVVSPDVAAQAGDLQVAGSYPVTEEQWLDGERTYYCFVTRGSGEPITGDARGPASTQG